MDNADFSINEKITLLRSSRGLSQNEMAELANIPFRTYQNIEYKRTKEVSAKHVKQIALALGISTDEILSMDESKKDNKRSSLIRLVSLLPDRHIDTLLNLTRGLLGQSSANNNQSGS